MLLLIGYHCYLNATAGYLKLLLARYVVTPAITAVGCVKQPLPVWPCLRAATCTAHIPHYWHCRPTAMNSVVD